VWWKEHGGELETRFKTWREQPVVTDAKPSTPDAKSAGDGKSKPSNAKPSTAGQEPKPGDAKAATTDEKPKPAEAKPSSPDQQTGSVPNAEPKPAPKPPSNEPQ
jgi:hypothetical protein